MTPRNPPTLLSLPRRATNFWPPTTVSQHNASDVVSSESLPPNLCDSCFCSSRNNLVRLTSCFSQGGCHLASERRVIVFLAPCLVSCLRYSIIVDVFASSVYLMQLEEIYRRLWNAAQHSRHRANAKDSRSTIAEFEHVPGDTGICTASFPNAERGTGNLRRPTRRRYMKAR